MVVEDPGAISRAYSPAQSAAEAALREARTGEALSAAGNHAQAQIHFTEAVILQPEEARFHWLLAICEWSLGRADVCGYHLQTSVRLNPSFAPAQASLGGWYLLHGMVEQALKASAKAVDLEPENVGYAEWRAWAFEAAGELDKAWALVQHLFSRGHAPPSMAHLYARLARRYGHQEQALALVHQLLQAGNYSPPDGYKLFLTAAELLDGQGRHDEAFACAARGNALVKPAYHPSFHQQAFDRMIQYFTRQRLRCLPRAAYRHARPVFIVGMPRSGTSLVEQILASHPSVFGAGELDFMDRVFTGTLNMLSATEAEYPACLDDLSVSQADGMAQIYLEPLSALNTSAARIIDKFPLNFIHLGLIAVLLPEARVIHCRRDPVDTCLSCFMTSFNAGNQFKYDLGHLGTFYRQYERLMSHWKSVLDIPILDVFYEDMVGGSAEQSRRVVEFIGLPWNERCLKFHETVRPVPTASVLQVRRPIYNSSVNRRRHYEKHLPELLAALGGIPSISTQ